MSVAVSTKDYARVLEISNDVLKSSPSDARAAKEKVIALMKLDKYKETLAFLDECAFLDSNDTILERGFCLYKLGRGTEAQRVLEHGSGRAVEHVQAQNLSFTFVLFAESRHIEWRILL
jgi:signal recognition particle subunit SRP72